MKPCGSSALVMFTLHELQPSRRAIVSAVDAGSRVSSSNHRRPREMASITIARVSAIPNNAVGVRPRLNALGVKRVQPLSLDGT